MSEQAEGSLLSEDKSIADGEGSENWSSINEEHLTADVEKSIAEVEGSENWSSVNEEDLTAEVEKDEQQIDAEDKKLAVTVEQIKLQDEEKQGDEQEMEVMVVSFLGLVCCSDMFTLGWPRLARTGLDSSSHG